MFWSTAFAQGAGDAVQRPSMLEGILFPATCIVFLFYFLVSRPQQKRLKDHQKFITAMKRGDQVLTTGGIYGEVTGITDKFVTLEIADNVRMRILKSQILGSAKEGNA